MPAAADARENRPWPVVVLAAAWAAAVGSAAVVGSSLLGFTWGSVHAGLQMLLPYYVLPSSGALLVAVWFARRWLAMVAGLTSVLVCAMLLPFARPVTSVVGDGPQLDLYVANVRFNNTTPERAVSQALASGADVLVLIELTPAYLELFRQQGADQRYPFQLLDAARDAYGAAIYSRLPLRDPRVDQLAGLAVPTATVQVGDRAVELRAVHVGAPVGGQVSRWEWQLGRIRDLATHLEGPAVLAGDFNATRWHPAFRELIDGSELTDAHESVGRGLSASWPMEGQGLRVLGPFARLDHALVHDLQITEVRDLPASGSDHRPFTVTVALHRR
ncbi:MAG: endonuclease/exonuclease/phosphatase family protein [Acidimicrobiales bacterium]